MRQPSHGPSGEDFIRSIKLDETEIPFTGRDAQFSCQFQDIPSGDSRQARMAKWRAQLIPLHKEQIGCIGLCHKSTLIQHDGIVHTCMVGLDFRQDVVEQVVVVNFGVEE